jgi:cytochrome c biogenesis protein CcdA
MQFESISFFSYVTAFAGGVALSFTPCVFPLVPVVLAVIGASGGESRKRDFFLSCVYVLGMAFTFSVLGAAAAAAGALLGFLRTNPVVNLIIGNIILLFGLSAIGAFDLPVFNLHRAGIGRLVRGKGAAPVFLMGVASGFFGVPCAAPVLGAILLFIASTGSVFLGFSLLFVFALGLGLLLMIAGIFAGALKSLAGSARAMGIIQKALAAGMIIFAQYFIFKAGYYAVNGGL